MPGSANGSTNEQNDIERKYPRCVKPEDGREKKMLKILQTDEGEIL